MPSEWDVVAEQPATGGSEWDVVAETPAAPKTSAKMMPTREQLTAPPKPPALKSLQTPMREVSPVADVAGSMLPKGTAEAQQRIAQDETTANKVAGETLAEYSPITGVPQAARGAKNLVTGDGGRMNAASDVIEGVARSLTPLAVPAAMAAPVPMAVGLATGMAAQVGAEKGVEALGGSPEAARLAGNIAGAIPITGGGAVAGKRLRYRPKAVEAPTPVAPEIPTPKPIEIPDAGPVPKGPKSAAESAEVFVAQDAPKSAAESAKVFTEANKAERRAAKKPEVPETGIPENVARATAAREEIAKKTTGKTWDELSNSERIVIDDLIAEGYIGAPDIPSLKPLENPTSESRLQKTNAASTVESAMSSPDSAPTESLLPDSPSERMARNAEGFASDMRKIVADARAAQDEFLASKGMTMEQARALSPIERESFQREYKSWYDAKNGNTPNGVAGDDKPRGATTRRRRTQSGALIVNPQEIRESAIRARTQLTDEFAPIHDLTEGKNLPAEKDPYVGARLYAGHGGKVENRLDDLSNILRPAKKSGLLDVMNKYAEYERYEELAGRGINQFPDGRTIQQIQGEKAALEQSLGPQKLQEVKRSVGQYRQFHDNLLREAKDAGLISDASYQAILQSNEKYTPLQRMEYLADKLDDGVRGGSDAFSVASQDLVKGIKGSTKEIVDPLESTVRKVYKAVSLIERNKVAQQMADLSNDARFAGVVERVPETGHIQKGMAKFSVLRNGVKEEYAAPELVVDSLKRLHKKEIDIVTKAASLSSRALRAGATTMNLPFGARNVFRDFQSAMVNSKVGFSPIDWMKGFTEAIRRGNDYRDFLESGASFSGYYTKHKEIPGRVKDLTEGTASKVIKTALNPFKLIPLIGETTELAPRIGVYKRGLKKGLGKEEAAFNARNATVDFAKSGTAIRLFNLWVPFLNARTQGSINTALAFRDRPIKSSMIVSGMIGVPALATYINNIKNHGGVWNDIAQFEKDNNFLLIYGDKRDEKGNPTQVVKIPKGDVGRIFGNPLENFMEYLRGANPKSLQETMTQIASDVSPVSFEREGKLSGSAALSSVLPPAVKGAVEGATNKNLYTDRDIVPQGLKDASPSEQYYSDTPKWLTWLGGKTNISPLKWQNFLGTQFGGVGRQVAEIPNVGRFAKSLVSSVHGARGGEQDVRTRKDVEGAIESAANERVSGDREAEAIFKELQSAPVEQRASMFGKMVESGRVNDDMVDRLDKYIERQEKRTELSGPELKLKSASVPARAIYIISHIKSLPADQKEAFLDNLIEKEIITDDVIDAIETRMGEQVAANR